MDLPLQEIKKVLQYDSLEKIVDFCSATRFLRKRDKINEKALGYDSLILLAHGSLRQLGINLRRVGAAVPEQPQDSG